MQSWAKSTWSPRKTLQGSHVKRQSQKTRQRPSQTCTARRLGCIIHRWNLQHVGGTNCPAPMARKENIDRLLRDWPYDPQGISVRKKKGDDGREILQMRLDLGMLQLETTGRPDGQ